MSTADARIRRFSTITWLAGSAVAVVLAFVLVPFVGVNPRTGDLVLTDPNRYEYEPWDDPDAQEARLEGDELSGTAASGFIELPPGDDVWVVGPLTSGTDDYLNVYQQVDAAVGLDDERPDYIGLVSESRKIAVVSAATGGRLWFAPRLTDWTASVSRETPTPIEGGSATGDGPALLSYDGDALSARFAFEGDGFFTVDAAFPGEVIDLVKGVDDVDTRASWPAQGRVILRVDTDEGAGRWTITLDEPASDTP
ncbi:hypothetical protein Q9S71_04615 [Microbacterium sp. KSW4-11]|uniref:Uncharacterized protein n=1 Tax=Microbacterium gawkjiense TaxID=3067309 RepID=A0ABU3G994_9MICO|nr:hypothetical protein [Microbacterium sp. KSW4-11]MDT3316100.1 hypothetical protein [Microbacterium sp. KSW4-11]